MEGKMLQTLLDKISIKWDSFYLPGGRTVGQVDKALGKGSDL